MTTRSIITVLALSLPLMTEACATSGNPWRISGPSSNPHDVFRTVTRAPTSADTHAVDAAAVERSR